MLGKTSKPVIKIITGSLISGDSQKSPTIESPRGLKNYDFGGVGLGIVAALDKSAGIPLNTAFFSRKLNRSNPIPVTRNGTNSELETVSGGRKGEDTTPFRIRTSSRGGVLYISSAEVVGSPPRDFLSSCNLCHKKLHGKDIYMYRGEKAFCSPECRYRQIVMDERTEKCSSEAAEVAGSPCMFTTGILAI